jgi:hypothetical protein
MYDGQWVNDKKSGYGECTFENSDCYAGQWLDNVPHGEGVFTWQSGTGVLGNWVCGKIEGEALYRDHEGVYHKKLFSNGVEKLS